MLPPSSPPRSKSYARHTSQAEDPPLPRLYVAPAPASDVSAVDHAEEKAVPHCCLAPPKYVSNAATGQRSNFVLLKTMDTPCLNQSVLDCLICIATDRGFSKSSIVISANDRYKCTGLDQTLRPMEWSSLLTLATQRTRHNITWSGLEGS